MDMNAAMNELTLALEAMDPQVLADGITFWFFALAAAFAAVVIIGLLRYLLMGIGYGKMYHKAGLAPWKAFIPVYNTYNNYKLAWNTEKFLLYAALSILFYATCNSAMISLQLASLAAGIALIVVDAKQNIQMSKLFGKGTGTGIALMFFPGITSLILGLGKAEFQAEMMENN